MNSPGILDGIVVAFAISLGAGAIALLFGGFVSYANLFNALLLGATLVYLVYLMRRSRARVGRIVAIGAWASASLACWFFDLPLFEQVLIQAGFIWLIRSLYFHGSIFAAVLDFGLVSVGLAAASWAMLNTGSLAAALWSFFLVQALFCWIPDLAQRQSGIDSPRAHESGSFQSAHRVALDAVRKLTQP